MKNGKIVARDLVKVGEYFVKMAIDPKNVSPPPPKRPEDWPDFLREHLDCIVPENFKKIHFRRSTLEEVHFMIPPKELVQASLDAVREDPQRSYPLPGEYERIANGSTKLTPEQVFYFRVGEYTLNLCR
ncbi:hypothetical protein [Oceanibacterium hippocampi]|uniref:Uncharacterized protein n=1 Tax=Oceanibacterium hippocampi TaxID=745714 RepID=A0A1Y5U382_9PROT|nr:hypothetical protein [Oceanibacterium hippocampi]SLN76091.1 hypothetical protein OCH7691_04032 [Oceanibacterium hippocampi]